jgi:hypothetical protein
MPFLEALKYIAQLHGCSDELAFRTICEALYDGKIESRIRGSDDRDGIEPPLWAAPLKLFKDGSLSWALKGLPATVLAPARYWVEVRREDVLRRLPEQNQGNAAESKLDFHARHRGAKSRTRSAVAAFIRKNWPDGIPPSVKLLEVAEEATTAIGRTVSERTLRRALGGK